jgi:hypothetical protein
VKIVQLACTSGALYALDSSGGIWQYLNTTGWVPIERPFPVDKPVKGARPDHEHPDFDEFYKAYPRKDARRAAAVAFSRALVRHPDYSGLNLAAAATLFAQKVRKESIEPRFIPLPATWLNQDRYREYFEE